MSHIFCLVWISLRAKMSYHCKAGENHCRPAYLSDTVVVDMQSGWDLNQLKLGNEETLKGTGDYICICFNRSLKTSLSMVQRCLCGLVPYLCPLSKWVSVWSFGFISVSMGLYIFCNFWNWKHHIHAQHGLNSSSFKLFFQSLHDFLSLM